MHHWSDAAAAVVAWLAWIGGGLLLVAVSIEPHAGAWIAALGGSCLAVAYGRDRGLWPILFHGALCFGIGVMVPSLIDLVLRDAPHPALAFVCALLGRDAYDMARRIIGNTQSWSDLAFWRRPK